MAEHRGWRAERGAFPTASPDAPEPAAPEPPRRADADVRRGSLPPPPEAARAAAPEPHRASMPPASVAPASTPPPPMYGQVLTPAPPVAAPSPTDVMARRNAAEPAPTVVVKQSEGAIEPKAVVEILREAEAERTRVFYRVMFAISVLVLVALPVLPGELWLRLQTAVACFFASAIAGWMALKVSRVGRVPEVITIGAAVSLCVLATVVIYFLGIYSASATILAVGIYFFGSSESRRVARSAYATTASLYFVVTLAIATGALVDRGVFSAEGLPTSSLFYRVVMQQAIFAMIFYLARSIRRGNEAALHRAGEHERELRMREAQLMEAKGELDRALRQGEGRLSGQTIGRFRIGDLLGRGGMGEVYAATDTATHALVAVKFLHPAMLEDPANVQRFLREAKATAAVPSEHVARVIEVGTLPSGVPFIVMELLEGHDLAFYLRRATQLALHQVVELVEHTARALVAVRDAGVVHRDLKPANIFLTDTLPRRWKVLDFGLSKLHGAEQITKDQAVGTPAYMAPEQIRGKDVDHKADLYALAAIAYRCITGRPPFMGDEVAKVLMDALTKTPESPSAFARIPIEVELVLAIGLAKRRSERFASATEFAEALKRAERGALDDVTRARGWALLKQYPWGERIRARSPDTALRVKKS